MAPPGVMLKTTPTSGSYTLKPLDKWQLTYEKVPAFINFFSVVVAALLEATYYRKMLLAKLGAVFNTAIQLY